MTAEEHGPHSIPADQKWFWMQAWQKREQEVDAYVAAGELDVHDNADEFLAHLGAIDAHRVDGSDSRRRDDQP